LQLDSTPSLGIAPHTFSQLATTRVGRELLPQSAYWRISSNVGSFTLDLRRLLHKHLILPGSREISPQRPVPKWTCVLQPILPKHYTGLLQLILYYTFAPGVAGKIRDVGAHDFNRDLAWGQLGCLANDRTVHARALVVGAHPLKFREIKSY